MKATTSFKKYFIEITGYIYLLLFTYAAFSKLSDYETFVVQLGQSPLLSAFAGWVSWFIPAIEISIALMLMFKQTQFLALNASFILMSMFTAYIYIILNYSEYIPCSCGGILEKMSWTEHLYFNIICSLIAIVAITFYLQLLENKNIKHKITLLTITTIVATAFVYFLFLRSEQIIHQENNFVRRYPPHLYNRMSKLNLIYGGYYFAGTS
ncbi:MAG: hypothetical protein K2P85_02030, partial [Flavobacteriaceae bacterium]|nr:hypothetical protein [Flavobacteriaceae bacterium]